VWHCESEDLKQKSNKPAKATQTATRKPKIGFVWGGPPKLADIFTQLKLEILNWTELWCELQVQINIF
jgi:hypothetical protein